MRFEVILNGQKLCTAGLDFGVITNTISWIRRRPNDRISRNAKEFSESGYTELRVGGLYTLREAQDSSDEFCEWETAQLKLGDEVLLRLLPPGPTDLPATKHIRRDANGWGGTSRPGDSTFKKTPSEKTTPGDEEPARTGVSYSIFLPSADREPLHRILNEANLCTIAQSTSSSYRYRFNYDAELEIDYTDDEAPREKLAIAIYIDVGRDDIARELHQKIAQLGITSTAVDR